MPVIIVFTLLMSSSCAKSSITAADLASAATAALGTMPQYQFYSASSEEYEASYLTEEEFSFIYTGEKSTCKEFSVLSDYYMLFSTGISVLELHVLRASDVTEVPALEKLVLHRAELLNRYRQIAYDLDLIFLSPNQAEVAVFGHWVILAVTPDNMGVFDAIKARLRS